jgi:hypothetical protein
MPVRPRVITATDLFVDPAAEWNACVDICFSSELADLEPIQRRLALVLRYEGEVCNGGHLQYFTNDAGEYADDTVTALRAIGANDLATILTEATARWTSAARLGPADADEYVAVALEQEFRDLDDAFYALDVPGNPSRLHDLMKRYVDKHYDAFLVRAPPAMPTDQLVAGLGDPPTLDDNTRAVLESLLRHERPGVRMRAAVLLWPMDRAAAEPVLVELAKQHRTQETAFADMVLHRLRNE